MSGKEGRAALCFLLPNLGGFLVFTLLPVGAALLLSLFQWDVFHPPRFVGLDNFARLLGWYRDADGLHAGDPRFWQALGNTLFLMLAIPVTMASALFIALILNQQLRARTLLRTVFFLPHVCVGVGLFLLWKFFYNKDFGLFNALLGGLGIAGPDWLGDYPWAKPALMIMNVWMNAGGVCLVVYLAGLQAVPRELYEAAAMDGAGAWGRFRYITWPLIAPTTFFLFITSLIAGFQSGFNAAYIMTQGGPAGATTTVDYYIFQQAFQNFNLGYAAAIAVVLFALIMAATLVSWRYGGRGVPNA